MGTKFLLIFYHYEGMYGNEISNILLPKCVNHVIQNLFDILLLIGKCKEI
jgi:hypothetical protein